ncbi:MAG TPA: UDP-4-amino-4,6-dideoxy-N-acetyl-beta-L-altrosamine transaminase [Alphaproteobacteria bacterium]|nr:UDP-4-amino-4,6-dideoxy-N-acetyl-beta-L-altrosamine transaminase [Alphaproteobacteria bacterium]
MLRLNSRVSAPSGVNHLKLPYGRHFIDEDDINAVVSVLRGDYLTTGPAVPAFESALADYVGARETLSCSSGTAALHLAALALGLGQGDTVIVPAITFLATANAARFVGAEVLFADVDPDTGLMSPEHLRAAIAELPPTGKRALFNVHYAGQCEDVETISKIARAAGLMIVDDACHAIGTEYRTAAGTWHKIGSGAHADLTCFSFHPVKTIAMGEGGAVSVNDPELAARIKHYRNHGVERDPAKFTQAFSRDESGAPAPWAYEMHEPGFNYRASDIHCALGSSQLKKLPKFIRERRELAALYDKLLEPLWPIVRPIGRRGAVIPAWHLYAVLIDFARLGLTRAELMAALKEQGIGTQVHYIPVARQPYFAARYGHQDLPGADTYYQSCLSLPLFVGMTEDDIARIVNALAALVSA